MVTGFGPFLDVTDNPSGRLAASVDGAEVNGWRVVGVVLPVSYSRGVTRTIATARAYRAGLVVGLGVDDSRDGVYVEQVSYAGGDGILSDVDGVVRDPADGERRATVDPRRLADAIGAQLSDDPGRYVCNGWLYDVSGALPDVPVGFVHMPPSGLARQRLLDGLAALVPERGSAPAGVVNSPRGGP